MSLLTRLGFVKKKSKGKPINREQTEELQKLLDRIKPGGDVDLEYAKAYCDGVTELCKRGINPGEKYLGWAEFYSKKLHE